MLRRHTHTHTHSTKHNCTHSHKDLDTGILHFFLRRWAQNSNLSPFSVFRVSMSDESVSSKTNGERVETGKAEEEEV